MEIKNANIDAGKAFDWGRTSADYAKYRDIYPDKFYQKLIQRNLFTEGQTVLISAQVPAYCQGICIATVRNG